MTSSRNCIYAAGPPAIAREADFVREWIQPKIKSKGSTRARSRRPASSADRSSYASGASPHVREVVDYLAAFYHGLPVKLLPPETLSFTLWDEEPPKSSKAKASPHLMGLATDTECNDIRTRIRTGDLFDRQLNLNNLINAAISILPKDAYALLVLLDHDIFEDDEDDFACGRACGGSRVAVVSMARYNPSLDDIQEVDEKHPGPHRITTHLYSLYVARWG